MSDTNDIQYDDDLSAPTLVQPAAGPDAVDVAHLEPQMGGSYTRNLKTGVLVKAGHAPVDQPEQE